MIARSVIIIIFQVADDELNCLRCHEEGALVAVGDECGKTYVIEMDDWFATPKKNDKALLSVVSHDQRCKLLSCISSRTVDDYIIQLHVLDA